MSDPTTDRPAVGMPCPRCRVDLVMSDRQGVEIDYCPQCRGVWLDRGELDKIIERNAQFQAPSMPDAAASQPPPPGTASPWMAPGQGAPGYAPGAPPPPGWGQQGYDQHGGHGGHGGGHGSGHGGGHGGSRDGHNNSFLGRLFR
jgi:Zn-finger nucleic acid-binding protein